MAGSFFAQESFLKHPAFTVQSWTLIVAAFGLRLLYPARTLRDIGSFWLGPQMV
jgi:hypothetical protein